MFLLNKIKLGALVFFLMAGASVGVFRYFQHRPRVVKMDKLPKSIAKQPGKAMLQGVKRDLNSMDRAELEWIAGIGPKRARRIIRARQKQPFRTWSEVKKRTRLPKSVLDQLTRYTVLPQDHEKQ
jgi:hypothetical protein